MKVNLTNEVDRHTLLGVMVLEGLSTSAIAAMCERDSVEGVGVVTDVVLTVGGHEVDVESFCKHWETQVDGMIRQEAAKRVGARADEIREEIEKLFSFMEDEDA